MFRFDGGQSIAADMFTGTAPNRIDDAPLGDERILDEVFNNFLSGSEVPVIKLSRLGKISGPSILSYSQGIIDALPRLASTAGSRMEEVDHLLRTKGKRHGQYLDFVSALCAQSIHIEPEIFRALIDNDERLDVTNSLRGFMNASPRPYIDKCVDHVGLQIVESRHALRSLTSFPIIFASVSCIDECLLYFDTFCRVNVDSKAPVSSEEGIGRGQIVLEIARAWISVLQGLQKYKERSSASETHIGMNLLSDEVTSCPWVACSAPVLRSVARHVQRLIEFFGLSSRVGGKTDSSERNRDQFLVDFVILAELSLELYAQHIRTNSSSDTIRHEYTGFKREFIEKLSHIGMEDSSPGNAALTTAHRLASRHQEYGTLLSLCEFIGDPETLRNSMRADVEFCTFVFRSFHDCKRITDLIGFADDFGTELIEHLGRFPDVLWILEVRQGQYNNAADSLMKIKPVTTHNEALALLSSMACATRRP